MKIFGQNMIYFEDLRLPEFVKTMYFPEGLENISLTHCRAVKKHRFHPQNGICIPKVALKKIF